MKITIDPADIDQIMEGIRKIVREEIIYHNEVITGYRRAEVGRKLKITVRQVNQLLKSGILKLDARQLVTPASVNDVISGKVLINRKNIHISLEA